jgi:hypothetical protein
MILDHFYNLSLNNLVILINFNGLMKPKYFKIEILILFGDWSKLT